MLRKNEGHNDKLRKLITEHTESYPLYRSRVTINPGTFVKLAVNHEIEELMGGEDGTSGCRPNFDYDACMYDTLYNITMAELGCTIPWLQGDG